MKAKKFGFLGALPLVAVAAIGTAAGTANAGASVVNGVVTEIDNTIPFIGCGGEPVITRFTGTLRFTSVARPDGVTSFRLEANETAAWDQHGVHYTVASVFSLVTIGDSVVDVTTNAIGSGSDGSSVRMHDVQHVVVHADGTVAVAFDKGVIDCG